MQNNPLVKLNQGFKERLNKWTHNPFKSKSEPVKLIYYKH
jgi:hypothetical protein